MNGKMANAAKTKIADHFIGGNRLDVAPAGKVKDFVARNGGHTVITNVRNSQLLTISYPASGLQALLSLLPPVSARCFTPTLPVVAHQVC